MFNMFPLAVFTLPIAWTSVAPHMWEGFTMMLVAFAVIVLLVGVAILVSTTFTGSHNAKSARIGLSLIFIAIVFAVFGDWVWIVVLFLLAVYLLVYWFLYRIVGHNLWLAVSGDKAK